MLVRDIVQNNRTASLIVLIGLTVIALTFIVYEARGRSAGRSRPGRVFCTVDDGATVFEDSTEKVPPFEHDGKEAVHAAMFVTKGGDKPFVGYLERCTANAKRQIEEARAQSLPVPMVSPLMEAKKPLDPAAPWVADSNREQFEQVTTVVGPDGSREGLHAISPGQR